MARLYRLRITARRSRRARSCELVSGSPNVPLWDRLGPRIAFSRAGVRVAALSATVGRHLLVGRQGRSAIATLHGCGCSCDIPTPRRSTTSGLIPSGYRDLCLPPPQRPNQPP